MFFANAIKENSTLLEIDLRCNGIGDEGGAKYISDMIKENSALENLVLLGNRIRAEGAKWIADSIKRNSSLLTFGAMILELKEPNGLLIEEFFYAEDLLE
jgi:Ran GTPase-activating protein (RanGAP) involved in mRNA processing and transport